MYRNAHSFTVFFLGEPDSSIFIGRLLIWRLALHQIERKFNALYAVT
jgi:hypothetical protein